jgi:hypothetical protein
MLVEVSLLFSILRRRETLLLKFSFARAQHKIKGEITTLLQRFLTPRSSESEPDRNNMNLSEGFSPLAGLPPVGNLAMKIKNFLIFQAFIHCVPTQAHLAPGE